MKHLSNYKKKSTENNIVVASELLQRPFEIGKWVKSFGKRDQRRWKAGIRSKFIKVEWVRREKNIMPEEGGPILQVKKVLTTVRV